jgi:predicted small metal-binding protein
MRLFTMPENDDSSADEAEPVNRAPGTRSTQSASWRCPLANCFRNMQPLEHGFRWREHMRKAHKYDNDQIAKLEEQLVQSGDIAPVQKRHRVLAHNPRGWQPPDPLKCPHCSASDYIFPKVSRLIDHIKRTHKYDPRIQEPPERLSNRVTGQDEDGASDKSSSSDEDSDGYMVGGVHNDGFLQPVLRHAGSRGRDLEQRAKRANARRSKAELKKARR